MRLVYSYRDMPARRQCLCWMILVSAVITCISACSTSREVYIRRPIPNGGGACWVERIVVEGKRPASISQERVSNDQEYWVGDQIKGPARMKISLGDQKIYFYKGDQLVGISAISSGREGMATRTGAFSVIEKDLNHKSSLFGDYIRPDGTILQREVDVRTDPRPSGAIFDAARMPYFMRITGAIGMHEGYLPGYPASHGCIRLPSKMAMIFFRESRVGTPVLIVQ